LGRWGEKILGYSSLYSLIFLKMRLENFFSKQFFIQILLWLALLSAAVLISVLFPVYFRNDDGTGLFWATSHSFIDAFSIRSAVIDGTYRPMNYIFWWVMLRVAGHSAIYYQIVVIFIFLANLYLFYLITREYFDRSTAIASIGLHFVFFHNLYYVAFWFSDTTFTIQIGFAFLSILYYIKSKEKQYKIFFSYLFALPAFLTKEPAIIIVIAFVISDIAINSKRALSFRPYTKALPYIFFGTVILAISPVTESRPVNWENLNVLWNQIGFRSQFYFEYITSGSRIVIPLALGLIMLGVNGIRNKWFIILIQIITVLSIFNWIIFYVTIVSLSLIILRGSIKLLPPFLWFLIT